MTQPDRVIASVEVKVDPETAFRIFTEEIDAWWERGPHNFYDGGRAVAKRFEPRIGGRYLEVYDDATGVRDWAHHLLGARQTIRVSQYAR